MLYKVHEKLIKRITDNYNRSETSNVSKMMKLAAYHIQENEDLLNKIHDWRDVPGGTLTIKSSALRPCCPLLIPC